MVRRGFRTARSGRRFRQDLRHVPVDKSKWYDQFAQRA